MCTHFTLIKYIGRDFYNINGNLTEDQVRKILLRSDDECLYQVSKWDSDQNNKNEIPELIYQLNGEQWLNNHL